jgi:hypothetical protein
MSEPPKPKIFWAGICDNKIDIRLVDNGFGGWGQSTIKAPMLFTSRKQARLEYERVCKVKVSPAR